MSVNIDGFSLSTLLKAVYTTNTDDSLDMNLEKIDLSSQKYINNSNINTLHSHKTPDKFNYNSYFNDYGIGISLNEHTDKITNKRKVERVIICNFIYIYIFYN